MRVEYRIFQYREYPQRQEGRNFAFLARIDGQYHLRALGLQVAEAVPDLAYYRAIAPRQLELRWVFAEWLRWLQDLVRWGNEQSERGTEVEQALDRLAALDRQITVTPPHHESGQDTRIVDLLNDLERRLLGSPGRPPDKTFPERIDEVLQESELVYRKGFARNVELEFSRPEGKAFRTTFPYAVTEAPRVACKSIAFHGSRRAIQQKVNDAYLSFQRALESGFLVPGRCIVFTEDIPKAYLPYAEELEGLARLLNVRQSEAPRQLQQWLA